MKRLLGLLYIAILPVLAWGQTDSEGWPISSPPPGDEFLTNRFGLTWSDPIYSGWVIVNGQYIDAPYVVEQRGYAIFVNGVHVENAVLTRDVLPPPQSPPVTQDPGLPPHVTRDSDVNKICMDPVVRAKRRYLDFWGLTGTDRLNAELDYWRSMPCVADIKPFRYGADVYEIQGKDGKVLLMRLQRGPSTPRGAASDEGLYGTIAGTFASWQEDMRRGRRAFANGLAVSVRDSGFEAGQQGYDIVQCLSDTNISAEERVVKLKALHFLQPFATIETSRGVYPIDGFRCSQQLMARISGDMAWTNATAMLSRLTNGWQRIEPKFVREKGASTNAPGVVAPPLPVGHSALPSKTASAASSNAIPEPAPVPKPQPAKRFGTGGLAMGLVAVALVTVGLLIRIVRRGSR